MVGAGRPPPAACSRRSRIHLCISADPRSGRRERRPQDQQRLPRLLNVPTLSCNDHRKVLLFRNSIESRCPWDFRLPLRNRSYAPSTKGRSRNKAPLTQVFSLATRSRLVSMREKNMRQNHIQSKNAKLFRKLLTAIQMARRSLLAAVALGMAASASSSAGTAHAQEYPWCVSRESYLYCFYKTQQQCQWTASGIGGCALNPRIIPAGQSSLTAFGKRQCACAWPVAADDFDI